jgi:hypothetical protein
MPATHRITPIRHLSNLKEPTGSPERPTPTFSELTLDGSLEYPFEEDLQADQGLSRIGSDNTPQTLEDEATGDKGDAPRYRSRSLTGHFSDTKQPEVAPRIEATEHEGTTQHSNVDENEGATARDSPIPFVPMHTDTNEAESQAADPTPQLGSTSQDSPTQEPHTPPELFSNEDDNSGPNPIIINEDSDDVESSDFPKQTLSPTPRLEALSQLDAKAQYLGLVHPELGVDAVENLRRHPVPVLVPETEGIVVHDMEKGKDKEKEGAMVEGKAAEHDQESVPCWGIRERKVEWIIFDDDDDKGKTTEEKKESKVDPIDEPNAPLPEAINLTGADGSGESEVENTVLSQKGNKVQAAASGKSKKKRTGSEKAATRNPQPRKRRLIPEIVVRPVPNWDPSTVISLSDFLRKLKRSAPEDSGTRVQASVEKNEKAQKEEDIEPADVPIAAGNEDMDVDIESFMPDPAFSFEETQAPQQEQPESEEPAGIQDDGMQIDSSHQQAPVEEQAGSITNRTTPHMSPLPQDKARTQSLDSAAVKTDIQEQVQAPSQGPSKRGRGRPKGSKNKSNSPHTPSLDSGTANTSLQEMQEKIQASSQVSLRKGPGRPRGSKTKNKRDVSVVTIDSRAESLSSRTRSRMSLSAVPDKPSVNGTGEGEVDGGGERVGEIVYLGKRKAGLKALERIEGDRKKMLKLEDGLAVNVAVESQSDQGAASEGRTMSCNK